MAGPAPTHPARRGGVRRASALIAGLLLAAVVFGRLPAAGATFTGRTTNSANTLGAASVAAPTGFTASKACVAQPVAGAVPAYRSMTSATGSLATGSPTVVLTKPAGTAAGDLLMVHFGFPADIATMFHAGSPARWFTVREDSMFNSPGHSTVLAAVAGGSEPTSYTFTLTVTGGGPYRYTATMLRFSGVDTRNPIDAHSGTVGTSSTTLAVPSLSTVSGNALLVSFAMVNAQTAVTPAAGMTELYDLQSGGTVTAEAATQTFATAGLTGNRTATAGSAGSHATALVALRPGAAHPAPLQFATDYTYAFNGNNASFSRPTSLAAGDLVILGAAWNGGTGNAPNTPAGYTRLRVDTRGSIVSAGWWYRVITGGETWPLSVGPSPGNAAMTVSMWAVRNVNTANPIAGSAVDNTHTGTTLTAPAITVADSHTAVFNMVANNNSSLLRAGAGTNWDSSSWASYGGNDINSSSSRQTATSTTTGTATFTSTASTAWIGQSLAVNPPPDTYAINAALSWNATSTAWATGYTWERWTGTLQQTGTVNGRITTAATDTTGLTSGTTYTYRLRTTTAGSWTSPQVTATLTPTACP